MNRREALKRTALIMGGTLSASTLGMLLNSCNSTSTEDKITSFSSDEKEIIAQIVNVIIPRTDTPGAVDAGVVDFIPLMIDDCYSEDSQKNFHEGLKYYNEKWCTEKWGKKFLDLSPDNQYKAVEELDKAVLGDGKEKKLSFYRTFKELTLLGFFTSEPGATETLRYMQVPGDYEGCIPYEEGDKAWAT